MSLSNQVITLVVSLNHKMMDIDPKRVKEFQGKLLTYFAQRYPEVGKNIEISRLLDDDSKNQILNVADEFKKLWDEKDGHFELSEEEK